jgi:hypothetical protein
VLANGRAEDFERERAAAGAPEDFSWTSEDAIRWRRLPAVSKNRRSKEQPVEALPSQERITECAQHWQRLADDAHARMGQPWFNAASQKDHKVAMEIANLELMNLPDDEAANSVVHVALDRTGAQNLGLHVHQLLEHVDLSKPADEAIRLELSHMFPTNSAGTVGGSKGITREQVEALVLPAEAQPLIKRFFALKDHLIARELPITVNITGKDRVPPTAIGRIDFLYRDPVDQAIVIGDWKTEAIDAGQESEVAASHRHQGRIYGEAVRRVFGLQQLPRFELWFLKAQRVIALSQQSL